MNGRDPNVNERCTWPIFAVAVLAAFALAGFYYIKYVQWPKARTPSTVWAAGAGNLQQLQQLQAQGMRLNYQDNRMFGWTPLMAAIYHHQTELIPYLLNQGVDLELRDRNGETALMWAVITDDFTTVGMLVEHGANTNDIWRCVTPSNHAKKERLVRTSASDIA